MRRSATALVGLACAAAAWASPALAYEIDPLTRQPLDNALTVRVRPQAVETVAVPVANTSLNASDPLASAVPQMSAIPRETVAYNGPYGAGTIVVSTAERRLYYVLGGGQALRYGVGVGRPGFTWGGVQTVTMKREWPDWRPPATMLRRRPDLPRYMKGGIENPLGARAMYLGGTIYRIHGSNEPESIGTAVSSGCIRMTNEDVTDLYTRAKVGTKVIVQR
jgi:lipoprotein-anchoring transpeptidase ErfK/SrfK